MPETTPMATALPLAETGAAAGGVQAAYQALFTGALVVLGVLLLLTLVRAVRGPKLADRVIAINLTGTLVVIAICVLAWLLGESYLTDVATIYTMLSFLAVVLLSKISIGAYRQRNHAEENEGEEGTPNG